VKPARRGRAQFKFRLYVAGDTQNSAHAVANFAALCRDHLPDGQDIEIVNVFREPQRALEDGIFMTPMLVKLLPRPTQRVIGTLSHAQPVLHALGLESAA
jgi:circadian clock protein KaiB